MSETPLLDELENGPWPDFIKDLKNKPPDDGCDFCESGWCTNPWGSRCPHFLKTLQIEGGCEKAL